jgi:hypothetical protein
MATPLFVLNYVNQKPNCTGFSNSKNKNKHYKAHVQGIPPNKVGAGDMANMGFIDANAYEAAGVRFINAAVQSHEWQLVDKDGNIARWDPRTSEFAVQHGRNHHLLTYHKRAPEQFAVAVFARAVKFYAEGSKGAWGSDEGPSMSAPNEWLDEERGESEFG